jgi:thiamine pyrophosphate-dependent acetolactate synthase large subunit-like protein
VLVIDNGLYEVTGGQATAGAGHADFAALARASGIRRTYTFDDAAAWRAGADEALSGPGPVLIWLKVKGRRGQKTPAAPRPMPEQIARLKQALGGT